jgi:hypothetical protein
MPRGGQDFVQSFVTLTGEGAFVVFKDFLHAVTDAPVGTVHMTSNDE